MNEFKKNLEKWFRVKFGILGGKEMFEETIGVDYNYDSYDGKLTEFFELDAKEDEIWEKYYQTVKKSSSISPIINERLGLIMWLIPWEKKKSEKSLQDNIDITVEQIKILSKIKENVSNQSKIISQLHGKVKELIGSYKKSLAQEIANWLQERNKLEIERLDWSYEQKNYYHSIYINYLSLAKRKISMHMFEEEREIFKIMLEVIKLSPKIEEVRNTINSYEGDIADLIEKYMKIMT